MVLIGSCIYNTVLYSPSLTDGWPKRRRSPSSQKLINWDRNTKRNIPITSTSRGGASPSRRQRWGRSASLPRTGDRSTSRACRTSRPRCWRTDRPTTRSWSSTCRGPTTTSCSRGSPPSSPRTTRPRPSARSSPLTTPHTPRVLSGNTTHIPRNTSNPVIMGSCLEAFSMTF